MPSPLYDPAGYYRRNTADERRASQADDPFLRLCRLLTRRGQHVDHEMVRTRLTRLRPAFAQPPLDPFPRLLTHKPDYIQHGDNDPEPALAVYEERQTRGFAIFHPEDRFIEDQLAWGIIAHTTAIENGTVVCGSLIRLGTRRAA